MQKQHQTNVEWLENRVLFCGDDDDGVVVYPTPAAQHPVATVVPAASPQITYPLSSLPLLTSLPSATIKLYLNFTGDTVSSWPVTNAATGKPYVPGTIPAYDDDGDATTFNTTELSNIRAIWAEVADKFSPFNIDVTTIKPSNLSHGVTFQMDIGGTNAWYGGGGGVGIIGGFTDTAAEGNVGFAFSTEAPDDINFIGADCAHEPGHGFGLNHQGTVSGTTVTEYSNGNSTTCPIMGNANNNDNKRGIWFNGTETGVDANGNPIVLAASQDDLSIIASSTNGVSYRPDDYSYSNYVTMVQPSNGSISGYGGVITNTSDDDPFAFTALGATANFTVTDPATAGMLAASATIRTSTASHSILASSVNNNYGCTISVSGLTPGNTYFLDVASQGGYGNIGEYAITGNLPSFAYVSGVPSTGVLAVTGYDSTDPNSVYISESGSNYVLTDNGLGGSATLTFPISTVTGILVSLGSGNDSVFLNGSLGNTTPITLYGGGGTDSLTLSNLGSTVSIYNASVMTTGLDVTTISGFTNATLNGSNVGTSYIAYGFPIATGGTGIVNAGTGNDTLDLIGADYATLPLFTFHGSTGTNYLYADNRTATTSYLNEFTDTQYGVSTGVTPQPVVNYDGITNYSIVGGQGGDFFEPNTTNASDTVNLFGGAGNDQFQLDNPVGNYYIAGTSGTSAGNDTVTVVDTTSAATTYTVSAGTVSRTNFSMNLNNIQNLSLDVGSGTVTTDVTGLPAPSVTINGATGTDTVLVSNNQVLPSFNSGLTINGATTLTINDAAGPADSATLTGSQFSKGAGNLYYQRVGSLIYDMPTTATPTLNILSDTTSTAYTVNADDSGKVYLGNTGDLSGIQTIFSPLGNTTFNITYAALITVNDSADTTSRSYAIAGSTLTVPGLLTLSLGILEPLVLYASAGTDAVSLTSNVIASPDTINCGSGNDTVTIGSPTSPLGLVTNSFVTVNGGSGISSLTVYNDEADDIFITPTGVGFGSASNVDPFVSYSGLTSLLVANGTTSSGGSMTVVAAPAGTAVTLQPNSGNGPIIVTATGPTGSVTLAPNAGIDSVTVGSANGGTTAVVNFAATQTLGALTINPNGRAVVTPGTRKSLRISSLATSGNATLDLADNDLDIVTSTLAGVTALVKQGYGPTSGQTWTGTGITSSTAATNSAHSTALAVLQNNQSGTPIFSRTNPYDGTLTGATDILVRYTYYGDANLDGKVDGSDYTLVDNGFNKHLTGWYNGDFNYDNVVNGSDYSLIDNAFNTQAGALPASLIAVATTQFSTTKIGVKPASPVTGNRPSTAAIPSSLPIPGTSTGGDVLDRLNLNLKTPRAK